MNVLTLVKGIAAAALLTLFANAASAAALLGQAPSPDKIYDAGNGLEWVYAGPCAGIQPSCGVVQLHHDFRFATIDEWLSSFGDLAGLIAAFDLNNYDSAICAAPEFNTVHNHCDPGDVISGYVWHAPVGIAASEAHANNSAAETFLVRGRSVDVPEPGVIAAFALGLFGLAALRRRVR